LKKYKKATNVYKNQEIESIITKLNKVI
jgi:hypothetical protein